MSYEFTGLDHVQLAAPRGSEEEARAFFGVVLGMREIPKPAALQSRGGVWFQCGVHQLHIGVQDDFVPARKAHPAFEIHNIRAFRGHLAAQGLNVQDDEALEGAERFYLADPFGNRLEFLEWNGKK